MKLIYTINRTSRAVCCVCQYENHVSVFLFFCSRYFVFVHTLDTQRNRCFTFTNYNSYDVPSQRFPSQIPLIHLKNKSLLFNNFYNQPKRIKRPQKKSIPFSQNIQLLSIMTLPQLYFKPYDLKLPIRRHLNKYHSIGDPLPKSVVKPYNRKLQFWHCKIGPKIHIF